MSATYIDSRGLERPLRSGAIGHTDSDTPTGPHTVAWEDATATLRDIPTYKQILRERERPAGAEPR